MHSLTIFENFGDAKILKRPSFEFFGDLYAGIKLEDTHDERLLPSKQKLWGRLSAGIV